MEVVVVEREEDKMEFKEKEEDKCIASNGGSFPPVQVVVRLAARSQASARDESHAKHPQGGKTSISSH
eukprot:749709-Hanusia_phi.AAC.1